MPESYSKYKGWFLKIGIKTVSDRSHCHFFSHPYEDTVNYLGSKKNKVNFEAIYVKHISVHKYQLILSRRLK